MPEGKKMEAYQITEWLHQFVRKQVQEGDICIDATMGNGNDTCLLSQLAGDSGKVLAFDIQERALENTRKNLAAQNCPENYELVLESHAEMGCYADAESVSCIMFNFGYLPGGDHQKATRPENSIPAIEAGLRLLKPKGLMTLCIYSGGDSGFREKEEILKYLRGLDSGKYLVICSEWYNRPNNPPVPVLVVKR